MSTMALSLTRCVILNKSVSLSEPLLVVNMLKGIDFVTPQLVRDMTVLLNPVASEHTKHSRESINKYLERG